MESTELKKIRALLSFSQQELADKLSISKQYISDLETGKKKINYNMAEKIKALPEVAALS